MRIHYYVYFYTFEAGVWQNIKNRKSLNCIFVLRFMICYGLRQRTDKTNSHKTAVQKNNDLKLAIDSIPQIPLIGAGFGVLLMLLPVRLHAQTFPEALALAYQNNPDLNAARAALRGTDEQVPQALANWRPTVSAVGSSNYEGVYSRPSAAGAVATPNSATNSGITPNVASEIPGGHQNLQPYSYGLQITQPLYRGGRTAADTSRAKNTVKAADAQLANTEETVLLNAGTAYLDVVRDEATIDLEVANDQLLQKIANAYEKRLEIGEITRTDVAQPLRSFDAWRMATFNAHRWLGRRGLRCSYNSNQECIRRIDPRPFGFQT